MPERSVFVRVKLRAAQIDRSLSASPIAVFGLLILELEVALIRGEINESVRELIKIN